MELNQAFDSTNRLFEGLREPHDLVGDPHPKSIFQEGPLSFGIEIQKPQFAVRVFDEVGGCEFDVERPAHLQQFFRDRRRNG